RPLKRNPRPIIREGVARPVNGAIRGCGSNARGARCRLGSLYLLAAPGRGDGEVPSRLSGQCQSLFTAFRVPMLLVNSLWYGSGTHGSQIASWSEPDSNGWSLM